MVHKSTKDPYVRFWIEDGVEVAMCTAADFREAMNERDRLWAALLKIKEIVTRPDMANDHTFVVTAVYNLAIEALGRDKDGYV